MGVKVSKFLTEDNGNPSLMRLSQFIITCVVMLNWTIACIFTKAMVPLEGTALTLVLGSLGIKAGQKFFEAKVQPPTIPG